MPGSNRKINYTVAKTLHWMAAFLIAFNLLSGWTLGDYPLAQKRVFIMIHSGIGTTIFILMLTRLWWRITHRLYLLPGWWRRPSMLLQNIFYPLVLLQPVIGIALAAYIDYEVLAFGFINYSALAPDMESLQRVFLQMHKLIALVLILLILCHALERSRKFFIDDSRHLNVDQFK